MSARPGVPDSTTLLPIADLEDPLDDRTRAVRPRARSRSRSGRVPTRRVGRGRSPRPVRRAVRARDRRRPRRSRPSARPPPSPDPAAGDDQLDRRPDRPPGPQVYGLTNTLAAPLTVGDGVVGAIVLSAPDGRRPGRTRPAGSCCGAAAEASAALARAYSHRAAEAKASTDALTGLPNRRYFDEFCGLLARRRRAGDAVGILMIDIDKFKVLNDTLRARDRRRGPARGRRRDRRGGPRGRRPGPLRRRGVRRPAAQPEPGRRARGRRARPSAVGGARPAPARRARRSASRSASPSPPGGPVDRRPHRAGRPGPLPGQARGPRPGRRRLTGYHRAADATVTAHRPASRTSDDGRRAT